MTLSSAATVLSVQRIGGGWGSELSGASFRPGLNRRKPGGFQWELAPAASILEPARVRTPHPAPIAKSSRGHPMLARTWTRTRFVVGGVLLLSLVHLVV